MSELATCMLYLLLLCALISVAGREELHEECSREKSREVRSIIEQFILPYTANLKYTLPAECPLNPVLDSYLDQERYKQARARGQWQCGYCSKIFKSEQHLDAHMGNRHPENMPPEASRVCLADYHALLHTRHLRAYQEGEVTWATDPIPCKRSVVQARQDACLQLAAQCFPPGAGREAQLLHDHLAQHFCLAHSCDGKRRRALLRAVVKAHRRHLGRWSVWVVLLFLLLCLFYLVLYVIYNMYERPLPRGRDASASQVGWGFGARARSKPHAS